MTSFSLTIALADDQGTQYPGDPVVHVLDSMANYHGVHIFARAHGQGYDPEGPDPEAAERILVWQGYGAPEDVARFGTAVSVFARNALKQRAIGWFISTDSYRLTGPDPE